MTRMKILFCRVGLSLFVAGVSGSTFAANYSYVKAAGTRFTLDGNPYYFAGANFWQGMNLGMADTNGGDRARLCRELDRLKNGGVVNLRVMAASEGPDTEPYRMVPSLQPAAGIFNEHVFEGLDYLLYQMDARGMRAVMQLNNYWHWSGGMAQYVSWAEASSIPYPPSYPDFTGDWWTFMLYSARFYTNAECQATFQACIRAVVERTNTFTGVQYKNDPTIFSWELANEPRLYPQRWVDDTAAYIKSLDTIHMITCGSEGEVGGDFIETHNGAQIDYATCHIWPQNWGWYDPGDPGTFTGALRNALAYLDSHAAMAETLNKPLVLEEFGLARDYALLEPDSPVTFRNSFFSALYGAVFTNAGSGGALAGDSLWSWAGESRPDDPFPRWMGDPPHETPGWYSVYDTDSSTFLVMRGHAAQMAALSDDIDRDQFPDSWELRYFSSITNTAGNANEDFDRDAAPDRFEYIAGTNPSDPLDYLAIQSIQRALSSPDIVISWNSVTGRLYTVALATNLSDAFTEEANFVDREGTGGAMTYTSSPDFNGPRFYRITVRIPQ
jgi:mannan endo-1,4-beta-mannosidase